MTRELFLLLLGALLILVAVLAGRVVSAAISLRALRTLRIAVAGTGVLCAIAALILIGSDASSVPAGPVRVLITDELGSDQVSEEIRVFLGGRYLGVIKVDEQSPKASLTVTVPEAGRRDYRTRSRIQIKGQEPTVASNEGEVIIDGESPLEFRHDPQGRTYLKPR